MVEIRVEVADWRRLIGETFGRRALQHDARLGMPANAKRATSMAGLISQLGLLADRHFRGSCLFLLVAREV